jgi:hypothetical protein
MDACLRLSRYRTRRTMLLDRQKFKEDSENVESSLQSSAYCFVRLKLHGHALN